MWRHASTGMLYLWTMNGSTVEAETYVGTVDTAYDIVGTGDYNGDGRSDVLWRHLANGELWVWLMAGAAPLSVSYVGTVADPALQVAGRRDSNGTTGRLTSLWRHATQGDVWVWLMNGPVKLSETYVGTVPDTGYQIVRVT